MTLDPDFTALGGHIWLNCAHQGPLPRQAAVSAMLAVEWKTKPHELTTERFKAVPQRLRTQLARLIGASSDDVVLANSASYGLHLLANALPLEAGDEVLVMANDFPPNILPWLRLEPRGITVKRLKTGGTVLEPDEIRPHVTRRTRVLCLSWVHKVHRVDAGHSIDRANVPRARRGVRRERVAGRRRQAGQRE